MLDTVAKLVNENLGLHSQSGRFTDGGSRFSIFLLIDIALF